MTTSSFVCASLLFVDLDNGAISIQKEEKCKIEITSILFSDLKKLSSDGICMLIMGNGIDFTCSKCTTRGCYFLPSNDEKLSGYFCFTNSQLSEISNSNIALCSPFPTSDKDRRMVISIDSNYSNINEINISHCNTMYQMIADTTNINSFLKTSTIAGCNVLREIYALRYGIREWTRVNTIDCNFDPSRIFYIGNCNFVFTECAFVRTTGKIDVFEATVRFSKCFKSNCDLEGSGVVFDWSGEMIENKHMRPREMLSSLLSRLQSGRSKMERLQLIVFNFHAVLIFSFCSSLLMKHDKDSF